MGSSANHDGSFTASAPPTVAEDTILNPQQIWLLVLWIWHAQSFSGYMISVSKADVPEYLWGGEFYKSLNDDDCECICVPENTLKPDANVSDIDDLDKVLSSLRFWAVEKTPDEVISFFLDHPAAPCLSAVSKYGSQFPYLYPLYMLQCVADKNSRLHFALEHGNTEIVRYMLDHEYEIIPGAATIAAQKGNVECLQIILERTTRNVWDSGVCDAAAQSGNLECLKIAKQACCPCNVSTAVNAARYGRLECLKFLYESGCPWDEQVCRYAAAGDHFDCLQYAHEHGCKWDVHVCRAAALCGSLRCLQFAHERGAEWDRFVCMNAAEKGYIECLKYAHTHGCPWDIETTLSASENGHLSCLVYAVENGCSVDAQHTKAAAGNGHIDCLMYLHQLGCPWDVSTTRDALWNEQLCCYSYAHANGCP